MLKEIVQSVKTQQRRTLVLFIAKYNFHQDDRYNIKIFYLVFTRKRGSLPADKIERFFIPSSVCLSMSGIERPGGIPLKKLGRWIANHKGKNEPENQISLSLSLSLSFLSLLSFNCLSYLILSSVCLFVWLVDKLLNLFLIVFFLC